MQLKSARSRPEDTTGKTTWVDELVAAVTDFLKPDAEKQVKTEGKPTGSLVLLTTRASEALDQGELDEAALHLSDALHLAKDATLETLKLYAETVKRLKQMRAAERASAGFLGDLFSLSQPTNDGVKLSARAEGPRKVLGRAAPNKA